MTRAWPTGLPLVDKLRSCMLNDKASGGCSGLPYEAAELIHDLYDALLGMVRPNSDVSELAAALAALAKARGEQ